MARPKIEPGERKEGRERMHILIGPNEPELSKSNINTKPNLSCTGTREGKEGNKRNSFNYWTGDVDFDEKKKGTREIHSITEPVMLTLTRRRENLSITGPVMLTLMLDKSRNGDSHGIYGSFGQSAPQSLDRHSSGHGSSPHSHRRSFRS